MIIHLEVVLFFLFTSAPTNFAYDEEDSWDDGSVQSDQFYIGQKYDCDSKCWFNESVVTSSTISHFPTNCSTVCGILTFTKNSDLSMFELTPYFVNLRRLNGALIFENTLYLNAGFMGNLTEVYCDHRYGHFSFDYNRLMEELKLNSLRNVTCPLYAIGNPKLNMRPTCEQLVDTEAVFLTSDNLENCDSCVGGRIDDQSVKQFSNCTSISGVYITDIFVRLGTDMSPLNRIENITGPLAVYNTDAADLSFLKSLKRVKSKSELMNGVRFNMLLENNPNLTRFGIENIEELVSNDVNGKFYLVMRNLHPSFCLMTSEMQIFLLQNVHFSVIEANYCSNETRKDQKLLCLFETMSLLPSGCNSIKGDVTVQSGDEEYATKLETVEFMFGSLTVHRTTLKDLKFLKNLRYVASLKNALPSIQISYNSFLEESSLPKLKVMLSFLYSSLFLLARLHYYFWLR